MDNWRWTFQGAKLFLYSKLHSRLDSSMRSDRVKTDIPCQVEGNCKKFRILQLILRWFLAWGEPRSVRSKSYHRSHTVIGSLPAHAVNDSCNGLHSLDCLQKAWVGCFATKLDRLRFHLGRILKIKGANPRNGFAFIEKRCHTKFLDMIFLSFKVKTLNFSSFFFSKSKAAIQPFGVIIWMTNRRTFTICSVFYFLPFLHPCPWFFPFLDT